MNKSIVIKCKISVWLVIHLILCMCIMCIMCIIFYIFYIFYIFVSMVLICFILFIRINCIISKVRMQTEGFHGRFGNSINTLTRTVSEEGILAVYKGAALPMAGWGVIDSFLWFGLMESRRQVSRIRNYNDLTDFTLIDHFLCGAIAGWTVKL